MPKYSALSTSRLNTCHPILILLFNEVIKYYDCTIIEGKRSVAQQVENVRRGVSRTLNSYHVYPLNTPSLALDAAPYPIDWQDTIRFYHFGGFVQGAFKLLQSLDKIDSKYYLRWGGDWDSDNDFKDQNFNDLVHFELRER